MSPSIRSKPARASSRLFSIVGATRYALSASRAAAAGVAPTASIAAPTSMTLLRRLLMCPPLEMRRPPSPAGRLSLAGNLHPRASAVWAISARALNPPRATSSQRRPDRTLAGCSATMSDPRRAASSTVLTRIQRRSPVRVSAKPPVSLWPRSSTTRCAGSSRTRSKSPSSQTITAPEPRDEPSWTPSNSPAARLWSGTGTASRRTPGSSDGPFGTAQERSTPSSSSRRSKCSVVASWSWTTKRAMHGMMPWRAGASPATTARSHDDGRPPLTPLQHPRPSLLRLLLPRLAI